MQIHEITEGILKGVNTVAAPALPSKAGFGTNAAEYFANRILNTAGVAQNQQGQYNPAGHMAASMGKGSATLRRQELEIARQLSAEWLKKKTMNDRPIPTLTHKDIVDAVDLANKSSYRDLTIDNDAVANQITKTIADTERAAQSIPTKSEVVPTTTTTPTTSAGTNPAGWNYNSAAKLAGINTKQPAAVAENKISKLKRIMPSQGQKE